MNKKILTLFYFIFVIFIFINVFLITILDKMDLKILLVSDLFIFIFYVLFSIKKIKDLPNNEEIIAGFEGILNNKNIIDLTENLHHEFSSPIEVLKYYISKHKNEDDIILIENSLEQIENFSNKIKLYKNLKYSNGDKTVYDIIKGAIKTTQISKNFKFDFEIDENFKNFNLKCLTNGDLLNILINHFKNSIEANATSIKVLFKEKGNGFINLIILDDGNGVPKKIENKIFNANFSTKTKENSGVRGNGLYISKILLRNCEGDDTYLGKIGGITTFEISIPV